jgi:hypothetical protein
MKLYHGTSERYLDSILRHGIRPRGRRKKSNWDAYPSRPDCVYLTNSYAAYFAERAAAKGEKSLIVEVDVDEHDSRLLPDEDFIAQAMAKQLKVSIESVHRGIRDSLEGYAHHAMDSLTGLGNVCLKGTVKSVTRYAIIDFSKQAELWQFCLDPSISTLNYMFCGEKYRSVISWLFGDRDDFSLGYSGLTNQQHIGMMEGVRPEYADFVRGLFANREGIEVHDHKAVDFISRGSVSRSRTVEAVATGEVRGG